TLPPGIDATVRADGYLTLEVTAGDPDGEPLVCQWRTSDPGGFSSLSRTEMHYGPGGWVSRWEFHPPPDAPVNSIYTLECVVTDPRGGSATGRIGATGTVQILPAQRIAFTDAVGARTYAMNVDGTGLTTMDPGQPGIRYKICGWSPDGSKLLIKSSAGWTGVGEDRMDLYVMNHDGSGLARVLDTRAAGFQGLLFPCFSPDGTQIAVSGDTGTFQIGLLTADGKDPSNPSRAGPQIVCDTGMDINRNHSFSMAWHPSAPRLLFGMSEASDPTRADLMEYELGSPAPVALLSIPGSIETEPAYSPDGRTVVYASGTLSFRVDPTTVWVATELWRLPCDPTRPAGTGATGPPTLFVGGGSEQCNSPVFSPDGQRLVFESNRSGNQEVWVSAPDGSNARQLTSNGAVMFEDDPFWTR
ncbi:MAG: hypothetical protein AB1758_17285, partial [Candidatus Eremiobacterota bacterium]